MKATLAAAAAAAAVLAVVAALTGCSVSTPAPAESTQQTAPPSAQSSGGSTPSASVGDDGVPSAGAREACELFNKLFADYAAVSPTDAKGYEDVYLKAQDAKDTVSGDLKGLFASLGLLAIDHSAAAESGSTPAHESKDAVRDAVFANSGTCTAEGVTLRL